MMVLKILTLSVLTMALAVPGASAQTTARAQAQTPARAQTTAQAQTPVRTVSPDDVRDGVVNVIDPRQIADLLVWARNSKTDLEDGLKRIRELSRSERHEALRELVNSVIGSSGDAGTELLMRSVLKRARNIDDLLRTAPQNPERETLSIRVLEDSARWAIELFPADEDFLQKASQKQDKTIAVDLDFTSLGISHGKYILSQLWMSPSLEVRLALVKESLSYFYNDLNRDNFARRNPTIANVLMKVANFAEKTGLDKSTEEFLKSTENLTALEKQSLARRIEAFYSEQLAKASEAKITRPSADPTPAPMPGVPGSSAAPGAEDSILHGKFIYVAPGTFTMGSPENERDRDNDERPHQVILTKSFYIQQTDVTQSQWYEVTGNNPSYFKSKDACPKDYKVMNGIEMCPNNPVENVSWNDVQEFINRLNEKVGHKIYRLPTEAEWEYAARAGTQTAYFFGNDSDQLDAYAWFDGNSGAQTHPVCTKKPNPLGLCDMSGNVWQWVQDGYGDYSSSPQRDPEGPSRGSSGGSARVLRGGSWYNYAQYLRSAFRDYDDAAHRSSNVGFRLVRTAP
jgi:formylglycine-generating enzyme required for sulfatase activity